MRARERWLRALDGAGLATFVAVWEGGGPKGIDDLIASGGKPRIRTVSTAPAELGARRQVREAPDRGSMSEGLSLVSARGMVEDAVYDFVQSAGQRR